MKRAAIALVAATCSACASLGGARHSAVVTVVSAHAVLAATQDTSRAIVCGLPTAPPAPACLTPERAREIAVILVTAFDLDGEVAKTVRAVPPGGLLPSNVAELVGRIAALVDRILAALPKSAARESLLMKIRGPQ